MNQSERHGLCQAIYAGLLGHIEATMYSVLEEMNRRAMLAVSYQKDRVPELVQEARAATLSILVDKKAKLETMTFDPLFVEVGLVFGIGFDKGPKRFKPDLEAIRDLRNVFVHGRSLSLPLTFTAGKRIDTDGTKMKLAVDRLIAAGVIDQAATRTTRHEDMGGNESELLNLLYSDAAVLHFVRSGRAFQEELYALCKTCRPETAAMSMFPELEER